MTSALLDTPRPDTAGPDTARPGTARPAAPPMTARQRPFLSPVPDCEPAYDDERTASIRVRALRSPVPRPRLRRQPAEAPVRQVSQRAEVISAAHIPGWSKESDVGVQLTASAALPPAGRVGPALARAIIEVLAGRRALAQLRTHCAPDVFAGLADQPLLRGTDAPRLLTTKICEPADGVAEISAVFRRSERVRALALRIQGVDGRWRVTALQVG